MQTMMQQPLVQQPLRQDLTRVFSAMPGYQVYEYQLVLALPESLKEKLRKAKIQLYENNGWPMPKSQAIFLPLVKFRQRQLLEEKVLRSLNQLIMGWRPFSITLKDYKSQPTHSIVIPVASRNDSTAQVGLAASQRDLKTIQHLLRPDREHPAWFPQEHQVVLASRLGAAQFEKAWQQYAPRHFTGQCLVDACLLLKRKSGDLHWQIAQRFEFRDLPVGVRQGNLFEA